MLRACSPLRQVLDARHVRVALRPLLIHGLQRATRDEAGDAVLAQREAVVVVSKGDEFTLRQAVGDAAPERHGPFKLGTLGLALGTPSERATLIVAASDPRNDTDVSVASGVGAVAEFLPALARPVDAMLDGLGAILELLQRVECGLVLGHEVCVPPHERTQREDVMAVSGGVIEIVVFDEHLTPTAHLPVHFLAHGDDAQGAARVSV